MLLRSELYLDLIYNPIIIYYHKSHQIQNYLWQLFREHVTFNSKNEYRNAQFIVIKSINIYKVYHYVYNINVLAYCVEYINKNIYKIRPLN